jgi:hypothetical protein
MRPGTTWREDERRMQMKWKATYGIAILAMAAALAVTGCEDSAEQAAAKSDGNALIVRNHYTWGGWVGFRGHQPYVAVGDYHVFRDIPPGTYEVTFESRNTPDRQFRTRGTVTFSGNNETRTVHVQMGGIQ